MDRESYKILANGIKSECIQGTYLFGAMTREEMWVENKAMCKQVTSFSRGHINLKSQLVVIWSHQVTSLTANEFFSS